MEIYAVLSKVSYDDATKNNNHELGLGSNLDAQRFTARRALGVSLEKSGLRYPQLTFNDMGAPKPIDGIYVSLSHKMNLAGAIAANCPIGIDVEEIRTRHSGLWKYVADQDEWDLIGQSQGWEGFYRIWTAKEAVLKSEGVGLHLQGPCRLTSVSTINGQSIGIKVLYMEHQWHVVQTTLKNHVISVAIPENTSVRNNICWLVDNP